MKKTIRITALAVTAALSLASVAIFAGCETSYPEVSITYEFNGKEYEVEYVLSRKGSPQTVQHFMELVETGYYDGTVIHDYQTSYLYAGAYVSDSDEESGLREKDYWTALKEYETAHEYQYTQTVWSYEGEEKVPLYTLHGEFESNGVEGNARTTGWSERGTLFMYYTDKGEDSVRVCTLRSDGGESADGDLYNEDMPYEPNSVTSMFGITLTGASTSEMRKNYTAFATTKNYDDFKKMLDAIEEYEANLSEDVAFTEEKTVILNQHDPFNLVQSAKIPATYNVPIVPIVIKSAKITKF